MDIQNLTKEEAMKVLVIKQFLKKQKKTRKMTLLIHKKVNRPLG